MTARSWCSTTSSVGAARGTPRFARQYADLAGQAAEAVAKWAADVRERRFPSGSETYAL